jgi:hypothetical protein
MEGTYLPADDFYTGAGTKQIQLSEPAFAHAVLPLTIDHTFEDFSFSCGFGGGSKQMCKVPSCALQDGDKQGCTCLGRVKLHALTVIDIHRSIRSGNGHLCDEVDT